MTDEISLDTVIVRSAGRTSATIDEVTAVMDPDADAYLLIDAVGSDIWTRIEKPIRIRDLSATLRTIYDVDSEVCARDVLAFVNELVRRGLAVTA